jgi:cytochrome c oxidase subunit 2
MIKILALIVVVLTVITIARIVRILELVSKLSPENEVETAKKDNKFNGLLLFLFLIFGMIGAVYTVVSLQTKMLPESASAHGASIDHLMNTTYAVIGVVFVITHILLFWYAYKYQYKKENKALFYPENHKLELIWTIIPTIVLSCLIVYGLKTWNNITEQQSAKDAMVIQLYAKQFDWTARYSGKDNQLGKSNFRLIEGANTLGMDSTDANGTDDIITKEIHLPVNVPILFKFNSRDVIHSAYLPHFRVQMNLVPGMTTRFGFTPTKTTEEMRKITHNPKFDYILLCNKICGVAHYNMKMNVVVESKEQYDAWISKQVPYYSHEAPAAKDSSASKPVAMAAEKK